MRGLVSAFVITSLVALASVPPAHAQTKGGTKTACAKEPKPKLSEAKKKDEAKNAFKEGNKRFDASDYENALVCFRLADAYIPGAKPKFKAASSLDKLGRAAEAVAAYQTFLKDVAPTPDAKVEDKFKADVATAKARVEALKQTPNKVRVIVTPADAAQAKIALDGAPQPSAELTVPPGKHTITVTADGFAPGTVAVELGFAETREVSIVLTRKPEAGPRASGAPDSTAPPAKGTPARRPPEHKGKILMGVGAVFLGISAARAIMGGIYGGVALAGKAEFERRLLEPHDYDQMLALANETNRAAELADFSFGAAIPGTVTGLVLLIVGATRPDPPRTGQTLQDKAAAVLRRGFIAPVATPDGGGAAAQFSF